MQDYQRDDGLTDISAIKSVNGNIEYYIENDGKIWIANDNIKLINSNLKTK